MHGKERAGLAEHTFRIFYNSFRMDIDEDASASASPAPQEIETTDGAVSSFLPPSIHSESLLSGESYAHYTLPPSTLTADLASCNSINSTPCVLGVDEAGRGPVLGPMTYSAFYLPVTAETPLLATTHHFNDSKQLTPAVRNKLMRLICTEGTGLHTQCGWAIKSLSAQDISSGMLRPRPYNLNEQAYDATIEIIKGVIDRGVNVTEIYVDTVGRPETYQKRLSRVFPAAKITVEKKADSKFPCVSAASVVAKVTRDISLEVLWGGVHAGVVAANTLHPHTSEEETIADWGSGYPSDSRCVTWMKKDMDPLFGWGDECRFSWATAKDMFEIPASKFAMTTKVDWPVEEDEEGMRVTNFFSAGVDGRPASEADVLRNWFGTGVGPEVF